jgi:hypothetical protein
MPIAEAMEKETASLSVAESAHKTGLTNFWRTSFSKGFRILGILAGVLSLIFALYAGFFPVWVYGLLFDSNARNAAFFGYGLGAPFRNHPILSLLVLLLIVAIIGLAIFARRVVGFTARHTGKIVFVSICILVITSVSVYAFCKNLYTEAERAQEALRNARTLFSDFSFLLGKLHVPDTAYFFYLDKDQIGSLYAEIEPEWLNKQRTITQSRNSSAGVNAGPVGVSGSTGDQNQTVQESSKVTPEKSCLAVMQYTIEKGRASSFSTPFEWIMSSAGLVLFSIFSQGSEGDVEMPLNSAQIAQQKEDAKNVINKSNSPQSRDQANAELAKRKWKSELSQMLTNPSPFVFIKGRFKVLTSPELTLIHPYIGADGVYGVQGDIFRPVQFNVNFPLSTRLPEFKDGSLIDAEVFGKVLHGLDSQGVVAVRALAFYK